MKSDSEQREPILKRVQLDANFGDWGPDLFERLDPKEIVESWVKAGVRAATVPAKNHWGYTFYETSVGTRHPALKIDLLEAFVEEGRRQDFSISAYYSIGRDTLAMEQEAKWVQKTRMGTPAQLPTLSGSGVPWTLTCINTEYGDYCLNQIDEITSRYPIDGLCLGSIEYPPFTCYCDSCNKAFRAKTGHKIPDANWADPLWIEFMKWKAQMITDFLETAVRVSRHRRPDIEITCSFPQADALWISGQHFDLRHQLELVDYASSEVRLDMYGTLAGPVAARLGRDVGGCRSELRLSRFSGGSNWSTKPPAQMCAELAGAVTAGAAVSIVDHLRPDGSMDPAAFETVELAFDDAERLEPWVASAEAMRHVGVLFSQETLTTVREDLSPSYALCMYGACRALTEGHLIYEFIPVEDLAERLDGLDVLVLTDVLVLPDRTIEAIEAFVRDGGGLVATYETAMLDEGGRRRDDFGLAEVFGVSAGEILYQQSYMRFEEKHPVTQGLTGTDLMVFAPQAMIQPHEGAQWLGNVVKPMVTTEKDWMLKGCSHPDEETGHPAVVVNEYGEGRSVYVSARLGEAMITGDPRLSRLFVNAVRLAGGDGPVQLDGPKCVEVNGWRHDRFDIVHLVNIQSGVGRTFPVLSPQTTWVFTREGHSIFPFFRTGKSRLAEMISTRRLVKGITPIVWRRFWGNVEQYAEHLPVRGPEVLEEILPIHDLKLRIRKRPGKKISRVFSPHNGKFKHRSSGGYVTVTVPVLDIYDTVVVEY